MQSVSFSQVQFGAYRLRLTSDSQPRGDNPMREVRPSKYPTREAAEEARDLLSRTYGSEPGLVTNAIEVVPANWLLRMFQQWFDR